jgi:hypothetical protein
MGPSFYVGRDSAQDDELYLEPARDPEPDTLELAVWTQGFCEYTRRVVDDTLRLSATLVRAGEVEGATLLLSDVGRDVHEKEAALSAVIRLDEDS